MQVFRSLGVIFFLTLLFASFAGIASAEPPDSALSKAKSSINQLAPLVQAGIITKSQADDATKLYINQASTAVGHSVTLDEVMAAPDTNAPVATSLTPLQKFAGLITFVNVLWVGAIIVGVLCISYLFGSYVVILAALFKQIPIGFYELVFYGGSLIVLIVGLFVPAIAQQYVGFFGCLLVAAALGFTVARVHDEPDKLFDKVRVFLTHGFGFSFTLFVVWTITAIVYNSQLIGIIAVGALLSSLGFSFIASPLCYIIGFRNENVVGRTTAVAFLILIAAVVSRIVGLNQAIGTLFIPGALLLGSFVGYLGLLISSSKWSDVFISRASYWMMQLVTLIAGLAALFVGSVFGIGELQKIGGTFFVLWGVEKLLEIPATDKRGYAAVGLLTSAVVFGFCLFVRSHTGVFTPYLFLPG